MTAKTQGLTTGNLVVSLFRRVFLIFLTMPMKGPILWTGSRKCQVNMMLEPIPSAGRRPGLLSCACFGISFPLFVYALEARSHGMASAARLMLTDPLHTISFAFPALATVFGHRLHESQRYFQTLVTARDEQEHQLVMDAFYDTLTGLPNRRSLERDMALSTGRTAGGAVILLDIDRFKFVNDTMGHDAGDALLIAMSERVTKALAGEGRLYRLGGDEFVAVMPGLVERSAVEACCLDIEAAASRPLDLAQGRVVAGISIGVTMTGPDERDVAAVLKRADLALYRAKEISGSSHAFFDGELATKALARIEIERDLLRALADEEFFLEYQPIFNIPTRRVKCLEALLRWQHPEKGLIAPDKFVPLAERAGLILPIGRWVLREACVEASGWPNETGVAVNVSGDQFKDPTFVAYVRSVLAETGLAPQRLTIEVTESVFTVDISIIQKSLADLRATGVKIALDDFGTGFSSINNLKRFPLDHLKIDKSFTDAMLKGGNDSELVSLMSRLGEVFQLSTTIEGVETETQLEFAHLMGIRNVQGYLISRPVPASAVAGLLAEGDREHPAAVSA